MSPADKRPCAMRRPKRLRAANASSTWSGLLSPVSSANAVMSVSEMTRVSDARAPTEMRSCSSPVPIVSALTLRRSRRRSSNLHESMTCAFRSSLVQAARSGPPVCATCAYYDRPLAIMPGMKDQYGREIRDLRVSLTDKCNLRCVYCMPEAMQFKPTDELLSDDEILLVVRVAADLGVRKVRLTGGEPTVRSGLIDLVRRI